MLINEIFKSISGESIQAGRPAVFIRTFSCPLRCSWCDSMYAVEGDDFKDMTVDEVFAEVEALNCKYVIFTGGEPLIQQDAVQLILKLAVNNYHVEIETSGAVDISGVVGLGNVTVTMDWKCPSSGMTSKMLESNLTHLYRSDVLKCVVSNEEDLDEMQRISALTRAQVFVSPVFGRIEPKEIVEYMMKHNLNDVRFQLQLHKYVYSMDARGV